MYLKQKKVQIPQSRRSLVPTKQRIFLKDLLPCHILYAHSERKTQNLTIRSSIENSADFYEHQVPYFERKDP